jgi:hypothetical protein
MNKASQKRTLFGFPVQQQPITIQQSTKLNTEKNELIGIMAKYLTKKTEREQTINDLTKLEATISTSS